MMKITGMVLLTVGVIVTTSAGIRLGEADYQATLAEGRSVLAEGAQPAAVAPVATGVRLTEWFAEAGTQFLVGLVLLAVGALIGRVAIGRDGQAETTADGHDFTSLLAALATSIDEARDRLENEPLDAARGRIERSLEELVLPMVDARAALQRHFGLGGAALVLGPLSGAERLLNRAWSVLVDGHAAEGAKSLAAAAAEVALAREALEELHTG